MAVSTNQGMVGVNRDEGLRGVSNAKRAGWAGSCCANGHSLGSRPRFWAWVVSVGVHLIVLTAFGVVKFSKSKVYTRGRQAPTAKVSRIERLARAAPIIPKPKVKRTPAEDFAKDKHRLSAVKPVFDKVKPTAANSAGLSKVRVSQGVFSLSSGGILSNKIEFFGSFAQHHKVCYVVDCSGSMRGVFGRVREELKESIGRLRPDQYFYIIFFGGDRLFEFGGSRLVRATGKAKSAAYEFIESIRPAGQTNALAAMERAAQIRDSRGVSASTVYFLTDGFELTTEDAQRFLERVTDLQRRFAPATRINTIGFWPQSGDRRMLERIAKESGGEFVLVDENDGQEVDTLCIWPDVNFRQEGDR